MTDRTPGPENPEREEIEMLLPWYATGRLAADEQELVSRYLESDPELAKKLEAIEQEKSVVDAFNREIEAPTERALDRVMAEIRSPTAARDPAPARAPAPPSLLSSLVSALRDLVLQPTPMALRYAGAAAAIIIVVQAVGIGFLLDGGRGPTETYQTATTGPGAVPAADGPLLLIAFEDDMVIADISDLLSEAELRIVDGPRAGGLYVVQVDRPEVEPGDVQGLIDELGRRPDVRFVGRFE